MAPKAPLTTTLVTLTLTIGALAPQAHAAPTPQPLLTNTTTASKTVATVSTAHSNGLHPTGIHLKVDQPKNTFLGFDLGGSNLLTGSLFGGNFFGDLLQQFFFFIMEFFKGFLGGSPGGQPITQPNPGATPQPIQPNPVVTPQPGQPNPGTQPVQPNPTPTGVDPVKPQPVQPNPGKPTPVITHNPTPTSTNPARPQPTTQPQPNPTPTTQPGAGGLDPESQKVLQLVNQERSKAGLPALQLDECMTTKPAQKWAQHMANVRRMYHQPMSNITRDCPGMGWAGENIAMGQRDAAAVMRAWMNSSGHRQNILGKQYTHIGLGLARDGRGTPYWVQNFGSRR